MDAGWNLFGDQLHAFGFDPGRYEIDRLIAAEQRFNVRYINGFVGLPNGHPAKGASIDHWRLDPRGRLFRLSDSRIAAAAAARRGPCCARPDRRRAGGSDGAQPVARGGPGRTGGAHLLPQFLDEHDVSNVDFVKIDVDGSDFEILQSLEQRLSDRRCSAPYWR